MTSFLNSVAFTSGSVLLEMTSLANQNFFARKPVKKDSASILDSRANLLQQSDHPVDDERHD
jgi:hypothetical protein